MKALVFLLLASMPVAATATEIHMKGPVVGFQMRAGEEKCYAAIADPANTYYGEGYFHIESKAMCSMAKAAFLTGIYVAVIGKVESSGDTNSIAALEMVRAGANPYWPPYGRHGRP